MALFKKILLSARALDRSLKQVEKDGYYMNNMYTYEKSRNLFKTSCKKTRIVYIIKSDFLADGRIPMKKIYYVRHGLQKKKGENYEKIIY